MAESTVATNNTTSSNVAANQRSGEQFARFFQCFLAEQSRDLTDLRAAAATYPQPASPGLQKFIDQVISHYEYYYRAKAASAKHDVTPMFSPTWTSSTEDMFMWVGGWRPSAAFHLLYSKCGLQLEDKLEEILRGKWPDNLGNLSAMQLQQIDNLQRSTIKTEREITEEWAAAQEEVASTKMVEIAAAAGEGMEGEMEGKRKEALRVLQRADQLRIATIKGIVEILEYNQAVHFLIAAAELHLTVHEYGKAKDAATAGAMA